MKSFIEKTIHPPGITKPNRRSLFSTIGEVADIIRTDALKAFNAHFPYLADNAKLEEHGRALLIPRLLDDTEKEYRDRVATASFFLMRAGERAYIIEQLNAHFGGRYIVSDEFLEIYIKILDVTDDDRAWVRGFLDGLLNPNIQLTVADWFRFIENIPLSELQKVSVQRADFDTYPYPGVLRCDGRFLCDHGAENVCNGGFTCDSSVDCSGWRYVLGTVSDTVCKSLVCNGEITCNGEFDCSGYRAIFDPMDITDPVMQDGKTDALAITERIEALIETNAIRAVCDGSWVCNGTNRHSVIDAPMTIKIKKRPYVDGTRTPSCALCDGSIMCNGSYSGFDGWYCAEDIQEAVA